MLDWLAFQTFRGLMASLRRRDLDAARQAGARLGRLIWRLDPKWKRLAAEQAGAALGLADTADFVRRNYEHYGMLVAELANIDLIRERCDDLFEYERAEVLDIIRDGALVISGHLGNWELMGMHYVKHVRPISAMVKPIANPYVDRWINRLRHGYGVQTVTTRDNALNVRKLLRAKESIVTLADQNSLYHEGVFVDFFGRPASTHYGPAMLAIRAGVPVVSAFCTRTDSGKFRVSFGSPLEYDRTADLRRQTWQLTQALTARVEAAVRRTPEQWFWVHRRWKNQPKGDEESWKLGGHNQGTI